MRKQELYGKPYRMMILLALLLLGSCCFSSGDVEDSLSAGGGNQSPNAVLAARAAAQVQLSGEVPFTVNLDGSGSTDPDGMIVDYAWDFDGDGTFDRNGSAPSVNHTYEEAGTFNVVLRVTDDGGATDTDFAVITVGDPQMPPTAAGSGAQDDGNPLLVNFDGTASTDLDGEIVSYDWDFDNDGTFDLLDGGATPSHEYSSFGTKTVTLRVTDDNGLSDSDTFTVNLVEPASSVTAALAAEPTSGDAPLEVDFDASGSSSVNSVITTYDWDLDDDGTFEVLDGGPTQTAQYNNLSQSASFKGTSAPSVGENGESIYTITVRVSDDKGNEDTATATVTVNAIVVLPTNDPPVAALNATPDSGVSPLDVLFDAGDSTDTDGTIVAFDWDMDNDGTFEVLDGGDTQNAQFTALGDHTVTVRATDDDGDSSTASATVTVLDPPVAALSATPDSGDAPLDVALDASGSTDSDGTIVSYDWDFDNDGTFETLDGGASVNHSYSAGGAITAAVRVTDNDGLQDTATVSLDINNPPVADITADPASGTGSAPEFEVTFDASGSTDSDGTIVSYDWDMDDDGTFEIIGGAASQQQFYNSGGIYPVSVRVTDDDGAQDTATLNYDVNEPPAGDIANDTPSGAIPMSGTLDIQLDATGSTDSDGTIVQYNWDLDGDFTYEVIDGGPTQTVQLTDDGTYNFYLEVVDNDGATGFASSQSVILTPPTAVLTAYVWQTEGIRWDGEGSWDGNGTIVRYDFDYNNDGDYDDPEDQVDMGPYYEDFQFFGEPGDTKTVTLRVFDNDGLSDETSYTWTVPWWPEGVIVRTPAADDNFEGTDVYYGSSRFITLDGSTSFDNDGTIVQYDWDLDGDFVYEIIDGPATLTDIEFSSEGGSVLYNIHLRVFDNDGLDGYGFDSFFVEQPPA
ncbi:MAG: PKD domain-containing protein [Planctomycetales bacterium]|nr:PKD domain-containing protein [bacterium]UNM08895.1 MAG: PKD domain-containing protein [Planctomycetales bacterium]